MQFILWEYLVVHVVELLDEVPSPQFLCTASKYFTGNKSQIYFPFDLRQDLPYGI